MAGRRIGRALLIRWSLLRYPARVTLLPPALAVVVVALSPPLVVVVVPLLPPPVVVVVPLFPPPLVLVLARVLQRARLLIGSASIRRTRALT